MKAEFFHIGNALVRLLDLSMLCVGPRTTDASPNVVAFTKHTRTPGTTYSSVDTVISRLCKKYNVVVFGADGAQSVYQSNRNASKRFWVVGFTDNSGITSFIFPRWYLTITTKVSSSGIQLKLDVLADGRTGRVSFPVDTENAVEYFVAA